MDFFYIFVVSIIHACLEMFTGTWISFSIRSLVFLLSLCYATCFSMLLLYNMDLETRLMIQRLLAAREQDRLPEESGVR